MSSAELAVTAALGASAITAIASLGIVAFQQWLQGRAAARDAITVAVTEMLGRSMSVSSRAQAMGETMKVRSGIGEGIDVTLHQRKPTDPLELHDWMAQDFAPLNAAWSVIWARSDQELIRRANKLLNSCGEVISASTARQPADTTAARTRRAVVGDRWTPEMKAAYQRALVDMAHAREQLAVYARSTLGLPAAELFTPKPEDTAVPPPRERAAVPAAEPVALDDR